MNDWVFHPAGRASLRKLLCNPEGVGLRSNRRRRTSVGYSRQARKAALATGALFSVESAMILYHYQLTGLTHAKNPGETP